MVEDVRLRVYRNRIDFGIGCRSRHLASPGCGAAVQPVHDRLRSRRRHLDFCQFEARLHCDVPCVASSRRTSGKTTQAAVPWARPGSGITATFAAAALALRQDLPVRKAADLVPCNQKQLWRRIELRMEQARVLEDFAGARLIDQTSPPRWQN